MSGDRLTEGTIKVGLEEEQARRAGARLLVSLTGVTAVVILLILLADGLFGADPQVDRRSTLSARADGFRAIHDVCARLGFRSSRHRSSFGNLPPPRDSVLVIIDPLPQAMLQLRDATRIDDDQLRHLRRWIERGGRVVVALPGRPILSMLGMRLDESPTDTSALAGGPDPWVSAVLLDDAPPTLDWVPANAAVKGPGDLETAWHPKTDDVDLTPAHLRAGPLLTVFGAPTPKATSVVATLGGKPLVVTRSVGAGELWLASTSFPFSNVGVARGGAPFVARLLAQASDDGKRALHFDEYLHGLQRRRGFLGWVTGTALIYPVGGVLLLVALLGWRGAIAPRAPRQERTVSRRAKEEFVLSLADIGLRARHYRGAARSILETHRARLVSEGGGEASSGLGHDLAALADRIGQLHPFGPDELRTLVDEIEATVRRHTPPNALSAEHPSNAPASEIVG